MRAALSVISGVLATALVAGCSPSNGDEEASADEETTRTATEAEPSGPPPTRTEVVFPEFPAPSGFSEFAAEGVPFELEFEHVGVTYQLDGGTELEQIFITSYLLPEDVATETFDQRKDLIALYDAVSGYETSSGGTRGVASGYPVAFRYSIVNYDEDTKAFQRNFFVFDGNIMAQITCQWKDEELEAAVVKGCQEIQEDFTIPA